MNAPQETYTRNASLTKVIDGDTVKLNIDLGHSVWIYDMPVRIARINAPEMHAADPAVRERAHEARDFVQANLGTATAIVVQTKTRDKYGRWLGEIWFQAVTGGNWTNLSDALLAAGLADPYTA